jgi:hypothetical protein
MKRWLAAAVFVLFIGTGAFAAAKGPQIDFVDDKLSVNAESVSLGRLLHLFDLATGMKSKVPPELANRNISVKFSGLDINDGVKKMFQGQPLDYVVIQGQGIIVTAASQAVTSADTVPAYTAPPPQQQQQQSFDQPFANDFPGQQQLPAAQGLQQLPQQQQQQPQQQPPTIQTPFGPIANPRAQQAPNVPSPAPVQQNPLFPSQPNQPTTQPQQGLAPFGTTPVSPTPFGTPSPFGTPNSQQNNQNGLFNTSPVFNTPGAQQR